MGFFDKEHRGWGCLSAQLLVGATALWLAFSSDPSRWRYGKAAGLLFGTVVLAVGALRLVANLVETVAARPRTGAAVLVVALGLAVAAIALVRGRAGDERAALRQFRLQRYQQVRLGMTSQEVAARLVGPESQGTTPDFLDDSCTTSAGSYAGAAKFAAWARPDGTFDTFVAFDSTDRAVHSCFAIPCAGKDARGKCVMLER
jgi:hypothetical protein